MVIIHFSSVKNIKIAMLQLVFILVEQNSLSMKISGNLLMIILLKLKKQFLKYQSILSPQENADLIMIDQNGQQNNSKIKSFLITFNQLKNTNSPCIYIIEIQEMTFLMLLPRIEIDSLLELYILLQGQRKNCKKSQNLIFSLELTVVV